MVRRPRQVTCLTLPNLIATMARAGSGRVMCGKVVLGGMQWDGPGALSNSPWFGTFGNACEIPLSLLSLLRTRHGVWNLPSLVMLECPYRLHVYNSNSHRIHRAKTIGRT